MTRSLAFALLLAALAPLPARGAELEPHVVGSDEPASGGAPSEPRASAEADEGETGEGEDDDENWLDATHSYLEQRIFDPVIRLDRFFSDERDLEVSRSRSFIRWRNELHLEEAAEPTFGLNVSATLQLPGVRRQLRRLRIEIAGQTRDAVSALLPGELDRTGEPPTERGGTADAGLALRLWDSLQAHASIGAGVLVELPPGAYGRLRLRTAVPLGRHFLSRQALTGFWRTDTRFGTSGSAEIERPLSRTTIARLFGTATLSEVSPGVEWAGDLAVLAAFPRWFGAQVGAGANGASDALDGAPAVERYRVYTRLRRGFYRRWIFLELEPEYAWPWTPDRGRHQAWGIAFRVEVQFHGPGPDAPPWSPPGPVDDEPQAPQAPGP